MQKNLIQENRLLKWLNNRNKSSKIKYSRNLDKNNKEDVKMLRNFKISEDNFTKNNSKLKLEENNSSKCKKNRNKKYKCKWQKNKQNRESKDKNNKN